MSTNVMSVEYAFAWGGGHTKAARIAHGERTSTSPTSAFALPISFLGSLNVQNSSSLALYLSISHSLGYFLAAFLFRYSLSVNVILAISCKVASKPLSVVGDKKI